MERLIRSKQDVIPEEIWVSVAEWLRYDDASSLRSVSKLFCDVVKRSALDDAVANVCDVEKWLTCFPSAVSLAVTVNTFSIAKFPLHRLTHLRDFTVFGYDDSKIPDVQFDSTTFNGFKFHSLWLDFHHAYEDKFVLFDSFFENLHGIKYLEIGGGIDLTNITDAAFTHLKGIHTLKILGDGLWENRNITSASMHSLSGIDTLYLCDLRSLRITDSFFAPLAGIKYLIFKTSRVEITDAAFNYIKGVEILVLDCYIKNASLGLSQLTRNGFTSLAGVKGLKVSHCDKLCDLTDVFSDDYHVDSKCSVGYFLAMLKKFNWGSRYGYRSDPVLSIPF
jgi:hypothetical protein